MSLQSQRSPLSEPGPTLPVPGPAPSPRFPGGAAGTCLFLADSLVRSFSPFFAAFLFLLSLRLVFFPFAMVYTPGGNRPQLSLSPADVSPSPIERKIGTS